jgi:hypothetical protein
LFFETYYWSIGKFYHAFKDLQYWNCKKQFHVYAHSIMNNDNNVDAKQF